LIIVPHLQARAREANNATPTQPFVVAAVCSLRTGCLVLVQGV
jgi:hypothetical protein